MKDSIEWKSDLTSELNESSSNLLLVICFSPQISGPQISDDEEDEMCSDMNSLSQNDRSDSSSLLKRECHSDLVLFSSNSILFYELNNFIIEMSIFGEWRLTFYPFFMCRG